MIIRHPSKRRRRQGTKPIRIPIHPVLLAMLDDLPRRDEYVLPSVTADYRRHGANITKKVQRHFRQCGIRTHQEGTGPGTAHRAVVEVGFHSLRHSFVSLCRNQRAPLSVVEALVGHASPAMTRHYSHVGDDSAAAAIALLPSLTGDAIAPPKKTDELAALKNEVRRIAESMTTRSWKAAREALSALAGCGVHYE